ADRSSLRLRQDGNSPPQGRSRLGVIAVALVLVLGIGAGVALLRRPKATTGAPATASTDDDTGRATKTAAATVRVSIDSAPQDARVIRVDTSEVLGKTPFTIELPPTAGVVVLRFEKSGYEPVTHKILAD